MPAVEGPRPYNIDHLLGGASRILVSDDDATLPALPAALEDIIDNTFPYAPVTGYVDFGATKEGASYSREISSEGYEIQQATGNVLEEITGVERILNVSIAEFRKEHFKIFEESAALETVASTTTSAAQELIRFGGITDLTHRRMVAIGMRSKQSGVVEESATRSRGRFLVLVLYDVAIAADTAEVPLEKGSLSEMPLGFKSFPFGGEDAGTEHGFWLDEQAAVFDLVSGKTPTTGIDVHLGDHEYRVQPQRHAYLKRQLRGLVEGLSDMGDVDVTNLFDLGTDQLYLLLKVMIPDLMPKWEWDGYGTPQAAETDDYTEDADRSPTPPEIKGALAAAIQVNEFDWVRDLKNFVGTDLIRAQLRASMAGWAAEQNRTRRESLDSSPSSPPQNGGSDPTSSGLSVPTIPEVPPSG